MSAPRSCFACRLRLSLTALGLGLFVLAGEGRTPAPAQTLPIFVEAGSESGLDFVHLNGAAGQYYMPEIMGAGVALFDYDGDGDLDAFLVQGGSLVPKGEAAAREDPTSRLYRNDLVVTGGERRMRFADVTGEAALGVHAYGMGAAVGDYDGDGDLDLFVTTFGANTLYRNNGDGTFTDVTARTGLGGDELWSTSAAFLDFDRDGDLDLFVANYLDFTLAGNKVCYDPVGARDYCSPRAYRPVPDRLYRNEGHGRFTDVSGAAGIALAAGAGLGVTVGDYDGDGWLDVYVANDATPNHLWLNQGDGTFLDEALLAGAAVNAAGNPEGSMGIASGDFDDDGDEDLFITNIIGETYALYVNDGRGGFDDRRAAAELALPTAGFTGFGTNWFDYDNDGWLDLFVANGAVNTLEQQRGTPNPYRMRNQLFRNRGEGRFEETSAAAGAAFERAGIGRGAAFGDVDNDGDVDVVVTNNGGPVQLLLNQVGARQHWLQVRLQRTTGEPFGLGAHVAVERPGRATIWRRIRTDGSYLSASDLRAHAGLGASAAPVSVIVRWPDGHDERWNGVAVDRAVTLRRGEGSRIQAR